MRRRKVQRRGLLASALVLSAVLGAAVVPVVDGASTSPSGRTNGPLVYQSRPGRIAIATIGSDESTAAGSASAVPNAFPLEGSDPAFSASGLRLAFARRAGGRRQIFVADADGTNVRQLTRDPAEATDPSWAPDGTQLAFTSTRNGRPEIYAIGIDGRGERRLTNDPADALQPDWSPSRREIAFVSTRTGNLDIWRMNDDGSGQLPVTAAPAREVDPDWRQNGRTLAFARGTGSGTSIFIIERDGSGLRRLTAGAVDRSPSWSPIGDAIAFTRARRSDRSTWVTSSGASAAQDARKEIPGGSAADWGALAQPPSKQLVLGGTTAAVTPEKGDVRLTPPDSDRQTPLAAVGARVPLGYIVHAPRNSEVTVKANVAPPQSGSTSAQATPTQEIQASVSGTFELVPPSEADPTALTLRLRGSGPNCSGRQVAAARAHRGKRGMKSHKKRVLRVKHRHGNAGKVRTVTHDSNASSKATTWVTEESCAGTRTRVLEGVVSVEDRGLGVTVDVGAGESYLARRVNP